MPIHLPALNRRSILKTTALTGLGALFSLESEAADSASELWVLYSDTHIAADQATLSRDVNMAAHLKQAVTETLSLQEKERIFGLLVNGDLSLDHGEPGDYSTLVELMKPLRNAGIDLHLTMGNHDEREAFWAGCESLTPNKKLIPLRHLGTITSAVVNWVLLDSLDKTDSTPGHLGESQIAWLDRTLRDLPEKPTILMIHHNPLPTATDETKKKTGLTDTPELMQVIDAHPKVKAWIYGHTHNWEVKTKNSGLHLINLPPVAYPFNLARPQGWVAARVDSKGISLELRSLDATHPEHGKITRLEWS
jgi:3',5'-cyclic-AMP phosphodiesterase